MTAEEVWGEPDAWRYVRGPVAVLKPERASDYTTPAMGFTETPLYTRTAMEAYAAENVGEAFLTGKRAGMERAAEELRQIYVDCDAQYLEWNNLPPVGDEARNFAFDISRYALAALKEADQ